MAKGCEHMDDDLLEEYVNRDVLVYFIPISAAAAPITENGRLHMYSASGIVLEQEGHTLAYIPMSAIRMIHIKPEPTFWERLTGTY